MTNPAKKWNHKQQQFQTWLALPRDLRQPAHAYELAEALDVHEVTLSKWKSLPGFMEEVAQLSVRVIADDLPEVLSVMTARAKAGDPRHTRMFLDLLQLFVERIDLTSDGKPLPITMIEVVKSYDPDPDA